MPKLCPLTDARIQSRRLYGFHEDFEELPPRQTYTYVQAALTNGADLAAKVIMSPLRDMFVHGISMTPDGSSANVDNTNTSRWTMTDGTTNLATILFDGTAAGVAFPSDNVQTSLGTIGVGFIAAGGRLELAVTNGATVDTPAAVVTVSYSDAQAYPAAGWRTVATDDGTATVDDSRSGRVSMTPSDATAGDNDEIYCFREKETFKFAAGKPMSLEALIQFSEANTDDANVAFGCADAIAANFLVDNGGGPPASYSGAVIYKVDGGTKWMCESSNGTTQTTNTSTMTAGGSDFQRLRIEIADLNPTQAEVSFFVDDLPLVDSTNGKPIKHLLAYASITDVQVVLALKNGGANAETLVVDSVDADQLR